MPSVPDQQPDQQPDQDVAPSTTRSGRRGHPRSGECRVERPGVVRRQRDPGPRRSRGGPQASRHVHRLHRSRAACTTWSTRSSTTRSTRRSPATATTSTSRSCADGGVRVVDNGRGIPVDINPAEGKSTVEVVLTILHAGGKFGGGGYAVSGGLHGVGISVVNALSSRLDVEVAPRRATSGGRATPTACPMAPLAKGEATDETGTTITFWAERRRSSRPSSSTTRRCAPASSRWRSSTRACASR